MVEKTIFMTIQVRQAKISAEDVLPYTPGSNLECIVMGMTTTPQAEAGKRAYYGRRLISGIVRFIHERAAKEITITRFYATSVTKTRTPGLLRVKKRLNIQKPLFEVIAFKALL